MFDDVPDRDLFEVELVLALAVAGLSAQPDYPDFLDVDAGGLVWPRAATAAGHAAAVRLAVEFADGDPLPNPLEAMAPGGELARELEVVRVAATNGFDLVEVVAAC